LDQGRQEKETVSTTSAFFETIARCGKETCCFTEEENRFIGIKKSFLLELPCTF